MPNSDMGESNTDLSGGIFLFVVLFLFYVGLAGKLDVFTVGTGVVSALAVSLVFARLSVGDTPASSILTRVPRGIVYLPYLGLEIAKANLAIAYLALHPALPIDPMLGEYDPDAEKPVPLTILSISVTLTPGTLVLDTREDSLHVHSLTPAAFEDLLDGRLDKAVGFVFRSPGHRAKDPGESG